MTARDWLAKRAELEAAATEGPWVWEPPSRADWPHADESLVTETGDVVLMGWGYDASGIEGEPADRAFIADARTSAPAMRKALEAVLELHERDHERAVERGGICPTCDAADAIETALGAES